MINSKIVLNSNFFTYLLVLILIPLLITGPFLPDAICVVLSIIFLKEFNKNPKIVFFNNKIIIFYLLFLSVLILSSILSEYSSLSLGTSLVYFRFILFALGFAFLIKKNIQYINFFFIISILVAIFLSVNIIVQYSFNVDLLGNISPHANNGRYSSLFGEELIAGSFLVRFLFLGVMGILFIFNLNKNKLSLIFLYLILITFGIFLSGERTAFFMLIFNIALFLLYLKNIRKIILKFFIFSVFFTIFFININPIVEKRMFETTKNQILKDHKINIFSKIHESHFLVGFDMFKDRPFFGHGPKSFRQTCKEEKYSFYNGCATHPHNFYVQFLAETGALGLSFLLLFYFYIINQFIKNLLKKNKNKIIFIKLILYQTLIVNLFPLIPSGNFFNNWLSITMYIPLALLIFFETLTKEDEEYFIKKEV